MARPKKRNERKTVKKPRTTKLANATLDAADEVPKTHKVRYEGETAVSGKGRGKGR